MNERLTRADWLFLAVCAAVVAASLFVAVNWFGEAFPEASIDFKYDRGSSQRVAEPVLAAQRLDARGMKHTATFAADTMSRIFLERTLGLSKANAVMRQDVRLWWWSHRWFKPLQEEEYSVDVAPTGEIVGFSHTIPEDRAIASPPVPAARLLAEQFLGRVGVKLADLQPVAQSERQLPKRMQRIFTWESQSVHPAGAPYRHVVTVDGDRVSGYSQRVKVPDEWQRQYRELRSKNILAGNIDLVFMLITGIAAVVVFVIRLLRGDQALRMLLGIGAVAVVLVTGVALNSYPGKLADYDTTTSFPAFLTSFLAGALVAGIGYAMVLVVIIGAGEPLYRERFPRHLAMPRLWTRRALASKRVFQALILGYTLVAAFLAYQVGFYLIAAKFGAWSPADVPYDDALNSAIPWIAVLFAGFFPALSEEFLSRAFSIPFFERIMRSRVAAVVIAAFIWGFGHATYQQQPFYIRGVEVGLAGVVIGFLMFRFGILPLLIWHYTIDALYTSLLLLRSGNPYYVVSGGLSSLVFAVPLVLSVALYFKNKGFIPDDDLTNATMPVKPAPYRPVALEAPAELPAALPVSRAKLIACVVLVAAAIGVIAMRIPALDDAIDYRTTSAEAKRIAGVRGAKVFAVPVAGFRSWERESGREEGGGPGGFDSTAAGYMLRKGLSVRGVLEVMRTKIEAATWMVRAYTPMQKEEELAEVDPREGRVIGYHKYLDETRPGPRLEQAQAQMIAEAAFARYGVDLRAFELKEALSFQQPARRDWLFHFEERAPIVADVYRRVSVRVMGAAVTQFTSTVKVPDSVYREPTTLLNVAVLLARFLGGITLMALMIAGFVMALRNGSFPWKRALRWTAALAIIPIAATAAAWESTLFTYSTTDAWETFIGNQLTSVALRLGLALGAIFLAVAGIEAAYPGALELRRREGRARFGRAAVVGAVAAVALVVVRDGVMAALAARFPTAAALHGLGVPLRLGQPVPGLLEIGDAVLWTLFLCAAIGLLIFALRGLRARPWLPAAVGVAAAFLAFLDHSATPRQTPLMLAEAASMALVAWIAIRFLLGHNLLAYPLALALGMLASSASMLLQNHRPDLLINGIAVVAAAIALLAWAALPSERRVEA